MSIDRREFLERSGLGFGRLALSYLLGSQVSRSAPSINPLAAKAPAEKDERETLLRPRPSACA